jgi:hypothetical protein
VLRNKVTHPEKGARILTEAQIQFRLNATNRQFLRYKTQPAGLMNGTKAKKNNAK